MRREKIFFILFTLVFSCLLWSPSAQAQTPESVIVIYPATEEQEDSLALSVFFTVVDGSGRPIPQAAIETVNIELLGGDAEPVEASFENANTPFYIALLLDASGSMANVIGSVREAAQSAIDSAPPTARLAVIQFNDQFTPITEFTDDHSHVKTAIERVNVVPGASTCLYDSLYSAIELFDQKIQNPQERRAIILFTDGKDERRDSTQPCSIHTYNDVIDKALSANTHRSPIHTIGLCSAGCDNINRSELRNMASETSAFSAIGEQTDLGELFQEIMIGLSSQWVARASVFAKQGENQAALIIKLRDREAPLTTTFNFSSSRDYKPPLAPFAAQITGLTYNRANNIYNLSVSITSPEAAQQLIVQVWDKKGGTQILPDQVFENLGPTLQFERKTDGFEAERAYSFQIKAIDKEGVLITNEDGEPILAEKEVVYEPPPLPTPPPSLEFTIESVSADYETGQLVIDLNISKGIEQVRSYEGFIVDKETGQRIHDFGPGLFQNKRIQEILPERIQQLASPRSYQVTVYLATEDERMEAVYDTFTPVLPQPLTVWQRIGAALTNPLLLASIFVIIIVAIVAFLRPWSRSTREPELLRPSPVPGVPPPIYPTGPVNIPALVESRSKTPSPPPSPQLPKLAPTPVESDDRPRISSLLPHSDQPTKITGMPNAQLIVVESGLLEQGQVFKIEKTEISIGRNTSDQINDIDLLDKSVSRKHATIKFNGQDFMIYDVGATLKTRINGETVGKEGAILKNGVEIQLGPKTKLRFKQHDPNLVRIDDPNLTMLEEDDPNLTMLEEDDPNLTKHE